MNNPLISIIIPVYNAEKNIYKSIKSVLEQSYSNFELIIIDDFSSDESWSIINSFFDYRIKKIRRKENSGSAYLPREEGVKISKAEWIVNLDADDYLGNNYLSELVEKAKSESADICCSRMVICDEKEKKELKIIPEDSFNFDKKYKKNDAFDLTLPDWKISMNGALIKKTLWIKSLKENGEKNERNIHDDENLSRIMLYNANCFVVSRAVYFYNLNSDSITRKFNLKQINWRFSNKQLIEYVKNRTEENSLEYKKALTYDYYSYKYILNLFCMTPLNEKDLVSSIRLLKNWYKEIAWSFLLKEEKNVKTLLFSNFYLSLFLCIIFHFNEWRKAITLFKIMSNRIINKLLSLDFFAWHYVRKRREKESKRQLIGYYNNSDGIIHNNAVINIYNGAIQSGGLADRLKGILSTYYIAKLKNIPYKILFTKPFPLDEYLSPNLYNWKIEESEICFNIRKVNTVFLDNVKDSKYQYKKQRIYLNHKIKNNKQTHVYTNASFSYELDYSKIFNELFKPSSKLQNSIDREIKTIGKDFISVSCRFMDLLGDFNETHGHGFELSLAEKEELLSKIKNTIEDIHNKNNEFMILLNSDSRTFLKTYENVDYIYVIKGNITHIDNQDNSYNYEKYEKTFLDFMMISHAKKVYLIKSDLMFNSGFPYAASKVGGCRYEVIKI